MENVDLEPKIRSKFHFDDLAGESEGGPMLKVTALDATRTGTEAEDLANKLRRRVVGQDEAIQHIARPTRLTSRDCPRLAGRSGISSFSVRPAQARRGSWRRRPSVCSGIGAR